MPTITCQLMLKVEVSWLLTHLELRLRHFYTATLDFASLVFLMEYRFQEINQNQAPLIALVNFVQIITIIFKLNFIFILRGFLSLQCSTRVTFGQNRKNFTITFLLTTLFFQISSYLSARLTIIFKKAFHLILSPSSM